MEDNFKSFTYNGKSLSEDFSGFIKNEGDDLRFFNPSNFSQEFITPQFGNQAFFLGTTKENREFNLSISLEDITLTKYREFLRWLDPSKEGVLVFDYNTNYGYDVKVNSIGEATITPSNHSGEQEYHIELSIGFITKNDWAARNLNPENQDFVPFPEGTSVGSVDSISFYETTENTKELFKIEKIYDTDETTYLYHTLTNNTNAVLYFIIYLDSSNTFLVRDENNNNLISFESIGPAYWYSQYGIVLDDNDNFEKFNSHEESAIVSVEPQSSLNLKFFIETELSTSIKPIIRELI